MLGGTVLWLFLSPAANRTRQKISNENSNFCLTELEIAFCLYGTHYICLNASHHTLYLSHTHAWNKVTISVCEHVTGLPAIKGSLTCALFDSGSFFHSVPTELALKIILPEFCKPDIPPVVLQRPAVEVAVKTCKEKKKWQTKSDQLSSLHIL